MLNMSISSIYIFTPSISPSSLSALDWNIYPEAHVPIGRQLYLNFQNSVTIVVVSLLVGGILIVQCPVLISNLVTYWNPSICCIVSPILSNGYNFLTNFLLSLRQSVINLAVHYFLGKINTVVRYRLCYTVVNTPNFNKHLSSLLKVSLLILVLYRPDHPS